MKALYLISQHRKKREMQSICGLSHITTAKGYFKSCLLAPLLSAHGRLLPGRGCHPMTMILLMFEMSHGKASRVISMILIYCSAKGALLCSPPSRLLSLSCYLTLLWWHEWELKPLGLAHFHWRVRGWKAGRVVREEDEPPTLALQTESA